MSNQINFKKPIFSYQLNSTNRDELIDELRNKNIKCEPDGGRIKIYMNNYQLSDSCYLKETDWVVILPTKINGRNIIIYTNEWYHKIYE